MAGRLDPAEAARVCAPAARRLAAALEEREAVAGDHWYWGLASGLAALAGRLDPAEAARVCGRAALALAAAMENPAIPENLDGLVRDLAALAERLGPAEAAPIARMLADALERADHSYNLGCLVLGLVTVAGRVGPAEAARVSAPAARALAAALERETDGNVRRALVERLAAVAGRLDPAEAARTCNEVIEFVHQANSRKPQADRPGFDTSDVVVAFLLSQLDAGEAQAMAWELAARICSKEAIDTSTLSRVLTDTGRAQVARRASRMAVAMASGGFGGAAMAGAVIEAAEPFPCRLTTQELVELLKMPTCIGGARRVVLDHLGRRYGRRFANHWEFVEFATEWGLALDFTTPPRRPDPRQPLGRVAGVKPATAGAAH